MNSNQFQQLTVGCLCVAMLGCKVNIILCTHFLTGPIPQQDFHTYKCSLHKPFHPALNLRIISCCFSGKPTANTQQACLFRLCSVPKSSHLRENWWQRKQVRRSVDPPEDPAEMSAGEGSVKESRSNTETNNEINFSKHREDVWTCDRMEEK